MASTGIDASGFLAGLGGLLHEAGPVGAVVATLLVSGVLGLFVVARGSDLIGAARASAQQAELGRQQQAFQDRLLRGVDELRVDNGKLRDEVRAARAEGEALHVTVARLEVAVDLARAQLRRAIELLFAVADGRIEPHALSRDDIEALGHVGEEGGP